MAAKAKAPRVGSRANESKSQSSREAGTDSAGVGKVVGSMPPFITRLDYFGSRRDLWDDPKSYSKYIPAPDFKKTGMSRHRFEDIWSSLRWSKQLENAGGGCGQQSTRVCSKCTHPTDPAQKQYFSAFRAKERSAMGG